MIPETMHFTQVRRHEGGEQSASIDGDVKDGEKLLKLEILLRPDELIATKSRNARLDPARSDPDDEESYQREFTARKMRHAN